MQPTPIDFTKWTDAQLNEARRFADSSPSGQALLNEIARRQQAGTWLTDGSSERVAAIIASNAKNRRRRD
jgi:hypothetical protein